MDEKVKEKEIIKPESMQSHQGRKSGLELLKIIAIVSIITSHLIQSLQTGNTYILDQGYALNLQQATSDPQIFMLILMRYGGVFGNSIFFVCSAWFLLDDLNGGGQRVKKILRLVVDIWVVSMICLVVTEIIRGGEVSGSLVFKSIFPTLFSNNWYMTCYILFLAIYPFLNQLIYNLNQKKLLRCCLGLGSIYIGVDFICGERFYSTNLILWIAIYFCMAYLKTYKKDVVDNTKINIVFFVIGFFGNALLVLLTDILGLQFSFFSSIMLHWADNSNPFLILSAVGLMNLFGKMTFQNKVINQISGLSMLVYLIHDNLLVRRYFRPLLFQWLFNSFGYEYILIWAWIFTFWVFLVSLVLAVIYKETIQRLTMRASDWLYVLFYKGYGVLENLIL